MTSEKTIPKPIENADAEVVERQYGKLGLVYAETRSQVAESLGETDAARQWRQVEAEVGHQTKDQSGD